MCQRILRRLCNPSKSCYVRKVARLLARPLSNEYGFWVRFVSICVLYDPPETVLVAFADFARARPYRVSPAGSSENKTIAMQTPPVAALADPADERELVMSEVNLILDEINTLYLQPRGLDIHDMWRDVLRSSPNIATQIWYKTHRDSRDNSLQIREADQACLDTTAW